MTGRRLTREEAFADLKNKMSKETEDIVYRCKDCEKYNLCEYYHGRKETSQICHYFGLPERKTGKWINKTEGDYRCSNCRNIIELGDEIIMSVERFKYCPSCGAKMEE